MAKGQCQAYKKKKKRLGKILQQYLPLDGRITGNLGSLLYF